MVKIQIIDGTLTLEGDIFDPSLTYDKAHYRILKDCQEVAFVNFDATDIGGPNTPPPVPPGQPVPKPWSIETTVTASDGIWSVHVYTEHEDGAGDNIVSTDKGIIFYAPDTLCKIVSTPSLPVEVRADYFILSQATGACDVACGNLLDIWHHLQSNMESGFCDDPIPNCSECHDDD